MYICVSAFKSSSEVLNYDLENKIISLTDGWNDQKSPYFFPVSLSILIDLFSVHCVYPFSYLIATAYFKTMTALKNNNDNLLIIK